MKERKKKREVEYIQEIYLKDKKEREREREQIDKR